MMSFEDWLERQLAEWLPFFHAVAGGLLSFVGLVPFFGLWALAQLGGPTNGYWLFLPVWIFLFIGGRTTPAKTIVGSLLCGLLFALPISLTCFLGSRNSHGGEPLFIAIFTTVSSPLMMVFLRPYRLRRQAEKRDQKQDHA